MIRALIYVWVESQPQLKAEVSQFLTDRGIEQPGYRSGFRPRGEVGFTEDAIAALPDHDPDDVALMATCLTGSLFIPSMSTVLNTAEEEVAVVDEQDERKVGGTKRS